MTTKHIIIQISDTHLFGDKNKKINGANSYVNLKNVLDHIAQLKEKPELIVVSGDLSQDCTFESYQHLANLLNKLNIKYYLLPGNHDDLNVVNQVFDFNWLKGSVDYFLNFHNWFLYFIDTSMYPEDSGKITEEQFINFTKALEKNKNQPTMVFMHHHSIEINSPLMDQMILIEKEKFNNIIKENPQIHAVLFGHIHQVFERKLNDTLFLSSPATSYQILPQCNIFAVEKLTPGYRLIELNENKINSQIIWVD